MPNIIEHMNTITVCYSTHRIETLDLTSQMMARHDVIILEEAFHPDFSRMLAGDISIEDHTLELDLGYPRFTREQYKLLCGFYKQGKEILQIEPYLERLTELQYFFADGHSPDEVEPGTVKFSVYQTEKKATGTLLEFYRKSKEKDFSKTLSIMNEFARADGARFLLRDKLRAQQILKTITPGKDVYVEAGTIHLELYLLLIKKLRGSWNIRTHSVDRELIQRLGRKGSLYSPGDSLTLQYMRGRKVKRNKWELLCAQSLIYSLIAVKDELDDANSDYPHTNSDLDALQMAKQLSLEECEFLFTRIRPLSPAYGYAEVKRHLRDRKSAPLLRN